MRRVLVALALLAIGAGACATTDRPEGVVERWLISLNQGAAGDPGRYATEQVSDLVLPGWRELEPGELDVIEVGRGRPETFLLTEDERYVVPFVIDHVGPGRLRANAILSDEDGAWRVEAVAAGAGWDLRLPSEGGPGLDRAAGLAWAVAAGIAVVLIVLSAGLMRLARPGARTGSSG
jgi:hypothetical protein